MVIVMTINLIAMIALDNLIYFYIYFFLFYYIKL